MNRRRRLAWIAVLALSVPLPALADCVDGTRKPTAAEADFHHRGVAALVAALPPAPAGVKPGGDDFKRLPTLGVLCAGKDGHKVGEFEVVAKRFYILPDPRVSEQRAEVRLTVNVKTLPASASVPFAAYGAASPRNSADFKVNNVVWAVIGADTRLRQALAAAIDRAYVQSLVGKPLPTVAASEAFAAKAVPVSVAGAAPVAPAKESVTPAKEAAAAEPMKDAADTVNKLRGLFGR
jgi:hypothetical protein